MTDEIGNRGLGEGRRLLAVAREKMRTRHMAYRTEQTYLQWIRRYIAFHNRRHPRELGGAEVEQFLTYLAVDRKVSASTQRCRCVSIWHNSERGSKRSASTVLPA